MKGEEVEACFEAQQGITLVLVAQALSATAGCEDDDEDDEKVAGNGTTAKQHGSKLVG